MDIVYATREQVTRSLEIAHTSWSNSLIDQKLRASSRSIEGLLHRRFYPERRTILKDWPNYQGAPTWQLWLDGEELISLETLTSGGNVIPGNQRFLRRGDDRDEPPYSYIELDLSTAAAFGAGLTFQRSVSVLGLFGYKETDTSVPASGQLGGNVNSSVQSIVINPLNGSLDVGVGSLLLVGTERMVLTNRRMSDTGQNLQGTMTDVQSDVIVDVTDGTAFAVDEVILLGAERMKIDDIAGNNLIVTRAWDGTPLTTHSAAEDVYALRTFTAARGVLGSTAASHTLADSVWAHDYGIVNELCIAETVVALEQNSAGYARVVGSGANARESKGAGLEDLRMRAQEAVGRGGHKTHAGAV